MRQGQESLPPGEARGLPSRALSRSEWAKLGMRFGLDGPYDPSRVFHFQTLTGDPSTIQNECKVYGNDGTLLGRALIGMPLDRPERNRPAERQDDLPPGEARGLPSRALSRSEWAKLGMRFGLDGPYDPSRVFHFQFLSHEFEVGKDECKVYGNDGTLLGRALIGMPE